MICCGGRRVHSRTSSLNLFGDHGFKRVDIKDWFLSSHSLREPNVSDVTSTAFYTWPVCGQCEPVGRPAAAHTRVDVFSELGQRELAEWLTATHIRSQSQSVDGTAHHFIKAMVTVTIA